MCLFKQGQTILPGLRELHNNSQEEKIVYMLKQKSLRWNHTQ